MATFTDLLATLDPDDSYRRGKQFEHVCKWFLLNEPEYRSRIKKVWLWDEWPGWWGKEAGIDLVAEDRDRQSCGQSRRRRTTRDTKSRRAT